MSTRSSLYFDEPCGIHQLRIHIFDDFHETEDAISVEFYCSTCNCFYQFLMTEHLAKCLIKRMEYKSKYESVQKEVVQLKEKISEMAKKIKEIKSMQSELKQLQQ